MDIIFISELRLDILIGIYDWERRVPQTVQFDLEFAVPARRAAGSDRLTDTIDYAAVATRIEASLRENSFGLLERVAEHIAELVVQEFGAPWVKVSVTKLAPLKNVKRLGVTIERGSRPQPVSGKHQ
jgi:dihydroneopterin aldolase